MSDREDVQDDKSEKVMPDVAGSCSRSRPIGDLDSFDTEVVEACALHPQRLSAAAQEFVPLAFAANQQASLTASVGKSSLKTTASSRASSRSRPSSRAATMTDKRVQTDDSWSMEQQQLKDSHAVEMAALQQQMSYATKQLQVSEATLYRALCGLREL